MSATAEQRGRCLCGAIQVVTKSCGEEMGACHCGMCRRWCGGGPLLAVDCGTDVSIVGEENVGVYKSSAWAERGFCKRCGTNLFYRLSETRQYVLPVGLFDGSFEFTSQIFIDAKPDYYSFANETRNMTGAEVFAKYGPPSD